MRDHAMATTLRRLAVEAGAAIMAVYNRGDVAVEAKADASPVTEADLAADAVICAGLATAYPDLPVVTEERAASHALNDAPLHFLVDPLDGTKEFINRRGDFTVNIALIEHGAPIAGVVYAPAVGKLYRTTPQGGAVMESGAFAPGSEGPVQAIRTAAPGADGLRVVASKSHRDAATDAYIARYPVAAFESAGSSLKFCLVASGAADLYPRLGRTMEWDTAAGHAVLTAAGGEVVRLSDGAPVQYGKSGRDNPHFVAHGGGVAVLPA